MASSPFRGTQVSPALLNGDDEPIEGNEGIGVRAMSQTVFGKKVGGGGG